MTYRIYFLALLLLLGLAGPGCDPPVDDDDTTTDDDDDDATGDDDDATGDDDDFAETTFSGTLEVTPQVGDDDDSAGDDDDSAGDDDDSAGDDDDSASSGATARGAATVIGTFVVRYWQNLDAQLLGCEQTMAWTGSASFDFGVLSPDCNTCSGSISVDSGSVEDVSDPAAAPDDCSADDLANASENWGDALTNEENGFAWLEMPLLDVATAQGLGLQPTDGGTLQETIDGLANNGLELTHIGFVETVDSVFGPNGFDLPSAGANPPEAGAGYGAFWTVFKDPSVNPHPAGIDLDGPYFLGSFWLLQ